jgi:membrane-associated protein
MDLLVASSQWLNDLITSQVVAWGAWAYVPLFIVIFAETGFVVTPFLPGDTLLFLAGALAFSPSNNLNIWLLLLTLVAAAILGDTVNYWIGKKLGTRLLRNPNRRFLKKEHIDKTHAFFARYGGKTIVIGRFVPFVRTFAPFLAGVGEMDYPRFLRFNVIGAILWVGTFAGTGYFFGPAVEKNLTLVMAVFLVVTTIPIVLEYLRTRRADQRAAAGAATVETSAATGETSA